MKEKSRDTMKKRREDERENKRHDEEERRWKGKWRERWNEEFFYEKCFKTLKPARWISPKRFEKKITVGRIFLCFNAKVQNLNVFWIIYMIRIRFFGPRELIQKYFRAARYPYWSGCVAREENWRLLECPIRGDMCQILGRDSQSSLYWMKQLQ